MKIISLIFSFAISFLVFSNFFSQNVQIVFCDVGQGDAVLISHNSTQLLIDTGRSDLVLQCLESHLPMWDSNIEFLILTHMDADHIGGAKYVLEHYFVSFIFINPSEKKSTDFTMIQWALSSKRIEGTRVISTYPGQQVTLSNLVSFEVITPQEDFPQVLGENTSSSETTLSDEKLRNLNEIFAENNENDLSIGVKVLIGNVSLFTSGDLEENGEIAIIEKALLDSVNILKVGHHGSKSSSSRGFIELLQPEVSVISSGKNNQYNHPNPQVVEVLQKNLSNIFQTSESGAVKFESDGTVFWQKL